jgi:hypothetical protein
MPFFTVAAGPARRAAVSLTGTAVAALLLVSGCGSSGKSTGAAAASSKESAIASAVGGSPSSAAASTAAALPQACSLLTPAEAAAAASTPLMPPVAAGASGTGLNTLCQFTGPTTGPTAQIEVYVGDGAKKQLDIERVTLKHTFTTVAGVGDQCVQEDNWIFVEKNGVWASIHLVRLNDPSQNVMPLQTAIKELAARLP